MRKLLYLFALVLCLAIAGTATATYAGKPGRIAFAIRGSNGNTDIWSYAPNGTGVQELTSDPSFDACPAFSPNGRHVAFCSDRGGKGGFEIWAMNPDGTGQHQLTHLGYAIFPDYSPNGSRLAFAGHSAAANGKDDIYISKADGTSLTRLTRAAGNNDVPVWSPDGKQIAFISDRSGTAQVWTMNVDGTHQTELTADHVQHSGVDWSPDGRRLVYDDGNPGGATAIWAMNRDGTGKHRLTYGAARDISPAWSPDGRKIAFIRVSGTAQNAPQSIYVMDATGAHLHPLHPGGKQLVPAWQPMPTAG